MIYDKTFLRKKFTLLRNKNFSKKYNFPFHLIFNLIKKKFNKKKINIAGYYASNNEVNILKFLEESSKKRFKIALPVVETKNRMVFKSWNFKEPLYINNFGIPEPSKLNKNIIPDMVLVPLLVFDKKMNRIGYGRGYYDRALKKISKKKKNTITIGIAYSFQEIDNIPTNKYDFKLHYIFTEQGIINF